MFNVGERIYELRYKRNRSQEQFSEDIDVSREYLSRIENNNQNPSMKTLYKICNACNITIEEFFNPYLETEKNPYLKKIGDKLTKRELKLLSDFIDARY